MQGVFTKYALAVYANTPVVAGGVKPHGWHFLRRGLRKLTIYPLDAFLYEKEEHARHQADWLDHEYGPATVVPIKFTAELEWPPGPKG